MTNRIRSLWLPAWYPSKVDFLSGDFIERHAKALSKYADIVVLFVTKDFSLPAGKTQIDIEEANGLVVYRAYYNIPNKKITDKLRSVFLYYRLLFKLYGIAQKKQDKFDLVHIHISQRQGLLALYLRVAKGIKYLVTEQNSWFMPGGKKFYTNSFFLKSIIKLNFKYASAIHVVSRSLGTEIQGKFNFVKSFTVIPNVVDTTVFCYKEINASLNSINFLAITGDVYHKNTDGLIKAFANFIKKGHVGILHIAGPNVEELKLLTERLSVDKHIKFYGAIPNKEVARLMQETAVFVFFTRYETFGCVMAEAMCCGKPVIASKLPVLQENLTEFKNALFVIPESVEDLTEKLIIYSQKKSDFNCIDISASATAKYNYDTIGLDFLEMYNSVWKNN